MLAYTWQVMLVFMPMESFFHGNQDRIKRIVDAHCALFLQLNLTIGKLNRLGDWQAHCNHHGPWWSCLGRRRGTL